MKKKILALFLTAMMVLSLAACGNSGSNNTSGGGNTGDNSTNDASGSDDANAGGTNTGDTNTGNDADTSDSGDAQHYTIGICQQLPHVALDAATQGFQDAVVALLGAENVDFDVGIAAGDSATCSTIANGFVSAGVDLIMANATAALQSAASATADTPILATSITEYGVALGIEGFTGTVGTNISGTSDLPPLDEQAAMVKEWFPDAQTVGLIYCSAEPNSKYQVDNVQAALEDLGFTATQYSFSDTNDMASVVQNAADNSDVLYVPTDNACADNTGIIDNICRPAGIPVIAGEEGICAGCGVATLSISYYDLGYKTGEMAVEVLTGKADISEMPIQYAPQFTKKYNGTICTELGLTVPDGYEAIA